MRFVRTAMLATLGVAVIAGAATAAQKTMLVAFPDGSVQHIAYPENAAPRILVVQAPEPISLFSTGSPFAEMERISAMMDAQADAMLRQAAMMQEQVVAHGSDQPGKGIVMTNAQGQPVGVMHYSFTSSTTSADGCTRTVRYSSNGSSGDQPKLLRTSAGNCAEGAPAIGPAQGHDRTITPTATMPVAKPKPKITPVSAPKPLPDFTPSRT